ncbi:amidohydrolase family protein [Arthrobacter pascens]|uniref:amidohydrolase family protein n=1 Tax=Arthrobacter pascens TaxID=1677 RepID=UPI0027D77E82|nr:amidohydrolase family protein [Arthrobacter pascens]
MRPYVQHALETFGPDRLMYGGDWPVTLLNGGYTHVWLAVTSLIADLEPSERASILGGTAVEFYGLAFKGPPAG